MKNKERRNATMGGMKQDKMENKKQNKKCLIGLVCDKDIPFSEIGSKKLKYILNEIGKIEDDNIKPLIAIGTEISAPLEILYTELGKDLKKVKGPGAEVDGLAYEDVKVTKIAYVGCSGLELHVSDNKKGCNEYCPFYAKHREFYKK